MSYTTNHCRPSNRRNHPLQGEGSDKPVFVNIQRNKKLEGEYHSDIIEETRSYHGGRVRHFKLKKGVSPAAYNIRKELEE
jgi:hypothetical protein